MRHRLIPHPDSRPAVAAQVEVEATRRHGDHLVLRYFVMGKISELLLPPVTPPMRADELWQHTCFEAFLSTAPDGAYYEFNFAPSMQWAAYRFDGYRSGMRIMSGIGTPGIKVRPGNSVYELEASLALERLPDLPSDAARLGLSAVIEEAGGRKSYWALAHPPGKADFHHSVCFAAKLP